MEPSIHMFARGDKNPLTYYRQVPDVKRLVVDLGSTPGQIVERAWIDHLLNELAEIGWGCPSSRALSLTTPSSWNCPSATSTSKRSARLCETTER